MVTLHHDTSDRASSCSRHLAYDRHQADIAARDPSLHARAARPTCRDSFAYSRVHSQTSSASGNSENDALCNDYGSTFQSPRSEDQSVYCHAEGDNNRGQAIPYSVGFLGCRPNGQPLATILEKASHSTLHSKPSLVSITCRHTLPSTRNNSSVSVLHTQRYTHKHLEAVDEHPLQRIQEHANQEHGDEGEIADTATSAVAPPMPCSGPNTMAPVTAGTLPVQPSNGSQLQRDGTENEGKGLKGLLRDVIQHVRGAPRQGDSRSSLPLPQSGDGTDEQPNTRRDPVTEDDDGRGSKSEVYEKERLACLVSTDTGCPQLPPNEISEDWAGDCERSFCDTDSTGSGLPPIRHVPPAHIEFSDSQPLRHASAPQLSSSSEQRNEESIPKPALQHEEDDRIYSGTPPYSQRSRDGHAGTYTFDGTPIYRSNAPSLYEFDRAREVSFSGTASTSYSSTILGIDLDLHQETNLAIRRSITPVWVCAPVPNRPQWEQEREEPPPGQLPHRSITSSALPILLPIAAASGIVQPKHAVPYVSFYSPSGNLIQAEPSSSSSSPTTSYYRKALSLSEQTARPAAVPLTTPPHSSIAVPTHLKQSQQHNQRPHHHHTRSHIVPQHAIRGCDGVILRTNSFTPRSGVPPRRSPSLPGHPKSKASLQPSALKYSYKPNYLSRLHQNHNADPRSRFRAVASCTSLTTARMHKGKTKKPAETTHHANSDSSSASSSSASKKSTLRRGGATANSITPGTKTATGTSTSSTIGSGLAPLAAHTMRVCFCQPRDADGDAVPRLHDAGGDTAGGLGEACHDHAASCSPDGGGAKVARIRVPELGAKKA